MVNDLISTINANKNSDITECNKFISFLKKDLKLSDSTINNESKTFFINNKHLFKKVFKNSSSSREMAMLTASIYSKIYTKFASQFGYKHLDKVKNSFYKLQYNLSIRDLNESFNKFTNI